MNNRIKILHLEDSLRDSELICSIIESGDIAHEYFLADNKNDFIHFLETENIDIILSDYSLPDYNGNEALQLIKEKYSYMPFIFVSGAMGEDAAIDAMLNGATDYVLKHKLERLVPAIKRAQHEYELEIKRKQAEIKLKEKNEQIEIQNEKYIEINKELAFQNKEKEKRAAELIIANKELIFQNEEKEKRAAELTIAKDKAEESDRLKSAFLANMSHEIRTPMNGILGFAKLLKEPDITAEDKHEFISYIEESSIRMVDIINNILAISKIESDQMVVSISETNINEQIENIYTFFKPEVERKGIQIFFKNTLPAKESNIITDKEKFESILINLVKNAIKFTNTGCIEIGCNRVETYDRASLQFFVKDTGIGIHPDHLKIVFERFRQSSETLNRKYQGAGLGLSISKAFVEMLGGKIWLESELGKGSTIYFTIPYNVAPEVKIVAECSVLEKSIA